MNKDKQDIFKDRPLVTMRLPLSTTTVASIARAIHDEFPDALWENGDDDQTIVIRKKTADD